MGVRREGSIGGVFVLREVICGVVSVFKSFLEYLLKFKIFAIFIYYCD